MARSSGVFSMVCCGLRPFGFSISPRFKIPHYKSFTQLHGVLKWRSLVRFPVLLCPPSRGRQPGLSGRILPWCLPDDFSSTCCPLCVWRWLWGNLLHNFPRKWGELDWPVVTTSSPFLDKGKVVRIFWRCSSIQWLPNILIYCEQHVLFIWCFLG